MANNGALSASHSPSRAGRGAGTRRLNNKPVWIACFVAAGIVFSIFYAAVQRGKVAAKPEEDAHGESAAQFAKELSGSQSGVIVPRATPEPIPVTVSTPSPVAAAPPPAVVAPTPDAIEQKRREAYEAALKANTAVEGGYQQIAQKREQQLNAQQVAMLSKQDRNNLTPTALRAYQEDLAQGPSLPEGAQQNPNSLAAYNGNQDRWTLNTRLEAPRTPYIIRTGFVIPAVLISAMDSDLPGSIIAQVSQNVMDTPTGRFLLIPQGSRLIGEYSSNIQYGQSRVFVAWQRIIYPDGSALDLGAMPGTDAQGEAGFSDQTNNHFVRVFGSALLMSAITAGVSLSQPHHGGGYGNGISASDALSEGLGQNLGMAMSQMIERNLSIAPTLKIRAGFLFKILVVKDLTFSRPYRVANYN